MKKSDIKEGVTYQTKNGSAARKVVKITIDREEAKQHYRWLSPDQDAPFVIYEQARGPGAGKVSALAMASFASWAHSEDTGAPESVAELRAKLEEMRKALEPFATFYHSLTRVKRGNVPTAGVLWALDTGSEHEVEITVEHLARAAELTD